MTEEFETFWPPELSAYTMQHRRGTEVWNKEVHVEKYRVTIEKIDEPKEVVAARLQKLWDECDNMHHYGPLKEKAKELGYKFKGEWGSKR